MKRTISLVIVPGKPIKRVDLMNNLASICQILHQDRKVGILEIRVQSKGKEQLFEVEIKK